MLWDIANVRGVGVCLTVFSPIVLKGILAIFAFLLFGWFAGLLCFPSSANPDHVIINRELDVLRRFENTEFFISKGGVHRSSSCGPVLLQESYTRGA